MVLAFDLEILKWCESIRQPWLNSFFMVFHHLGNEKGYLILVPSLFFWQPKKWGIAVLATVFSAYLNVLLKDVLQMPRPFVAGNVISLVTSEGYTFPSGHAQLAATFWGIIAFSTQQRLWRFISIYIVLMIGLCRPYLGEHYPSDVLAGWTIGFFLAFLVTRFGQIWDRYLTQISWRQLWLGAALTSGVLLGFNSSKDATRMVGIIFGFAIVYGLILERYPQELAKRLHLKVFFYLFGMIVVIALYVMSKIIIWENNLAIFLTRFFIYTVLGAWIAYFPCLAQQMQRKSLIAN